MYLNPKLICILGSLEKKGSPHFGKSQRVMLRDLPGFWIFWTKYALYLEEYYWAKANS